MGADTQKRRSVLAKGWPRHLAHVQGDGTSTVHGFGRCDEPPVVEGETIGADRAGALEMAGHFVWYLP